MNETLIVGKTYKIFLSNGFQYQGKLISQGDGFIQILDRLGKPLILGKAQITTIEVLE